AARRVAAIARVLGRRVGGIDAAAHGGRPGAAGVRRLDAAAVAARLVHHARHAAGSQPDPQALAPEEWSTRMNVTQALGWALLHSVWQCTLAAGALASLLAIVPVRAARTRYALAVTTLILMLAGPVATAVRLRAAGPLAGAVIAPAPGASLDATPLPPPSAGAEPAIPAAGRTGPSLAMRLRAGL